MLPTPTIISPPPPQPLKRPGLGRPRGRPPGPKIPGQTKSSRNRNALLSNPLWNKGSFDSTAYDYLKHYKEELYRQYSQTLTLTQQMNQLGSFLPTPPQNNLLNSVNLLQTMQQLAGMNPLLLNQFTHSMNQLNPNFQKSMSQVNANMLKNFSDLYKVPTSMPMTTAAPNISSDHMRQLNNLAQGINLPNTNLINPQVSCTSTTSPKATFTITKSTSIPKTSTASTSKTTIPTFKYPPEISKSKIKDVTKTSSSYVSKVILFVYIECLIALGKYF